MTSVTSIVKADNVSAVTLDQRETKYFADSVEFCPADEWQDVFACGNYQLIEETKKKVGQLYLFRTPWTAGQKLEELQRLDSAAILDLKWSMRAVRDRWLLGQVCAAGQLQIYQASLNAETSATPPTCV